MYAKLLKVINMKKIALFFNNGQSFWMPKIMQYTWVLLAIKYAQPIHPHRGPRIRAQHQATIQTYLDTGFNQYQDGKLFINIFLLSR